MEYERMRVLKRNDYKAQYSLPLYLIISSDERSSLSLGKRYYIGVRTDDEIHWLHEAVCLGVINVEDVQLVPNIILGFASETKSKEEVIEQIEMNAGDTSRFKISPMLRVDTAKDFIEDGIESLPTDESQIEAISSINMKMDKDVGSEIVKKEIEEEQQ